ncbi:hypothetical protein D4R08_06585 [Corynebacterium xerosis]|uniref:hypothetical protein n=1 Tax=Corynebacterium xerosis TaxID=1725 RepID=UPI000EAF9003|nr:hypothetical protein [Corynebacterium xerosis]AYJ33007.1 hypothetical protein D4R08_06585 [Corynebacterium xerosis]
MATAALPLVHFFPSAWWAFPLVVAVPLLGAISFAGAIKARADGLAIASGFVTVALIPMLYALTVLLGGP